MNAPLNDVAAAIVIVGIVVGVVRIIPVVIIARTPEATAGKEVPAVMEAVAKPAMARIGSSKIGSGEAVALEIASGNPVTLNGAEAGARCRARKAVHAAADPSPSEATAARDTEASTHATGVSATHAAATTTMSSASASASTTGQSKVRRQHAD